MKLPLPVALNRYPAYSQCQLRKSCISEKNVSKLGTHTEASEQMSLKGWNVGRRECELVRGDGLGRGGWDLGAGDSDLQDSQITLGKSSPFRPQCLYACAL